MNEVVDEIYENETAEELYERIQREKEKLISEGKLKKQKKLPEISEDEIPFEIPKSWKWVRLGEVITLTSGQDMKVQDYSSIEKGIPYLTGASNIQNGKLIINRWITQPKTMAFKNDLLLTCKGSVGESIILGEEKVHIARQFMSIRTSLIDINFVHVFIKGKINFLKNKSKGIIPGIERRDLLEMVFPLPPLSEQKRISKSIDRLFEKLDEAKEKALSALNTFELRKAKILHLAIQGKLSKQLDEYKTAEELYENIQIEKEKLISEGKLKKQKKLLEIFEDEIPFEIPKSWKWVRLGEIGNWGAGSTPLRSNPNYYNGNIPWLKTGELNDDYINHAEEFITEEAINKTSLRLNPIGSVLIAMYGATIGKLGILNIESTTNQACCACITYNGIYNRYLFYYLKSMRNNFIRMGSGGAQPNISREKIVNYIFPLPPLEEQKDIVKLLDNIFEKEEKAKKLIESTLNKIELVKKSILARAVRGEL